MLGLVLILQVVSLLVIIRGSLLFPETSYNSIKGIAYIVAQKYRCLPQASNSARIKSVACLKKTTVGTVADKE